MKITSAHNPRVKEALRLRHSRDRQRMGRMIIDGVREIRRAVDGGLELVEAFVCPGLCGEQAGALVERLRQDRVAVLEVSETPFAKLAYGQRGEGLVAIAKTPPLDLARLPIGPESLVAVLEGVEKPGNVGAVLRSADAAGVSGLIVADGGTDVFNPNAIRASLGAIFSVPVAAVTSRQAIDWLAAHRFVIYAARVEATANYTDVAYGGRSAAVFGSEAAGLSDVWAGTAVTPIRLPMCGVVDSLNVSVAAAIVFYEALRQRQPK